MAVAPDIGNGHRIGGQVDRATVAARIASRAAPLAAPPAPAPTTGAPPAVAPTPPGAPSAVPPEADPTLVPFSTIRTRTAEHLTHSLHTAAHALVVIEVDFTGVEGARKRHHLTYLPFVARAVIDGVGEFPHLNGSVTDDGLRLHDEIGLGVAVDLDFQGLVVPVVHQAADLRLVALAERIDDLATRAHERHLTMGDLEGGTITVTNVGRYGTALAAPIINHPQVAIVSTDGVRVRPVAVRAGDDWALAFHPVGNLSLSFDHRAFDGAYAAAFLARVREILEQRNWEEEL